MARAPTDGDRHCTAEGNVVPILPRGSLIKPFEQVVGYTAVQSNHYVAVVGGLFHLFMCMVRTIKQKAFSKLKDISGLKNIKRQ
ncbi:MAG: hypothetical protein GX022_01810 [Clostridiaceae bacterium]|nr:hypothetical protein [Clostridiaceae bacterium]